MEGYTQTTRGIIASRSAKGEEKKRVRKIARISLLLQVSVPPMSRQTYDRNGEENELHFSHVEFYVKVHLGGKIFQNPFRAVLLKFRPDSKTPKQKNQEDDIPGQQSGLGNLFPYALFCFVFNIFIGV